MTKNTPRRKTTHHVEPEGLQQGGVAASPRAHPRKVAAAPPAAARGSSVAWVGRSAFLEGICLGACLVACLVACLCPLCVLF